MRVTEAENALPNGLHDAELLQIDVDYAKRVAVLEFIADYSGDDDQPDEPDRRVRLTVTGLHFISIPPPDLQHNYSDLGTAMTTGFDPLDESHKVNESIKSAARHLPPGVFCDCAFIVNWNDFIVIAAENARIDIAE